MSLRAPEQYRRRVSVNGFSETKTQQHHLVDVNLPQMMIKYKRDGYFSHLAKNMAAFGDFAEVVDFQDAQNVMANAATEFEHVPPAIRARYGNDPIAFAEAAIDPENKQILMEMGFDASYLPDPALVRPPTEDGDVPPTTDTPDD